MKERWSKRESDGGSLCWIRRLLARAFGTRLSGTRFVTDPSFPFFHSGWETLLAPSFGRAPIRRMDSFDEKVSSARWRKEFHFLIHALRNRPVWKSRQNWIDSFALSSSFRRRISWKFWEKREGNIIEMGEYEKYLNRLIENPSSPRFWMIIRRWMFESSFLSPDKKFQEYLRKL